MLTTAILVTAAFLPVYLLLRAPFWRLPLHVDTGFYVSNHTIASGRLDFSKGWNARFAGCSKVIPEVFYSLIYLVHCRMAIGSSHLWLSSYKHASRFYASLYNYATAIAVGVLACQFCGWDVRFYYSGLIVFALLSSEPQYGVYYECGELFGILGNVVSLLLAGAGVAHGDPWLVATASFVWCVEACFVKLSSAPARLIVYGAVIIGAPWTCWPVIGGAVAGVALYLAWIIKQGQDPAALIRAIGGHESGFGQRADWRIVVHRIREKLRCLGRTIRRQPLIPALAAAGAVYSPMEPHLVWVYFCAVLVVYVAQAADCWYYQIPLLAPVAILAGVSVVELLGLGPTGLAILAVGGMLWIWHNSVRAAQSNVKQLYRWCWDEYRPASEISRNAVLEEVAALLARVVAGRSLLVYGPCNQAYVLLRSSYSTPLVAPEYYLDDVCPGWQRELNAQLVSSPPELILDTSACFAAETAHGALGLDYRLTHVLGGVFRLFDLQDFTPCREGLEDAHTYAPQSGEQLRAEESRAGSGLVKIAAADGATAAVRPAAQGDSLESYGESSAAAALRELFESLAAQGYRRVGLYGAGRFTIRFAEVYRSADPSVVVVLDDRPDRHGDKFLGWPIAPLADAGRFDIDAIIVSTERFAAPMTARARKLWGSTMPVYAAGSCTSGISCSRRGLPYEIQSKGRRRAMSIRST